MLIPWSRWINRDELKSREHDTSGLVQLFVRSTARLWSAEVNVEPHDGFTLGVIHMQARELGIVEPVRE